VKLKPQYSGKQSEKFWKTVNSIPLNEGGEAAYMLGCALQDLETRVLTYIAFVQGGRVKASERERGGRKVADDGSGTEKSPFAC